MPAGSPSSASKLFPIIQTLKTLLPRGRNAINVVNPKLCDDAIQRLAPSLKPYVGCSIIDLNPGPGLWSSKLHEFLQPRSHVLVEPESVFHESFLQPLLDSPGSKYHMRTWELGESFDIHRYISEGLIPDRQKIKDNNRDPNQHNDSVLVIANLTRGVRQQRDQARYAGVFAALTFARSAQRMAGLHAQGLVRMLMWVPEVEKKSLIPQTVAHRLRTTLTLEANFHVEEIVTGGKKWRERRETFLDVESGKRVARRMEAAGIKIPQCRQGETQKAVEEIRAKESIEGLTKVDDAPRNWEKELQQLEEAFANGEFLEFTPPKEARKKFKGFKRIRTPEYQRMQVLLSHSRQTDRKKPILDRFLGEEAEIDALYRDILQQKLNPTDRAAALVEVDQRHESMKVRSGTQSYNFPLELAYRSDDRRAFALEPPLLMWDRREAEPLLAHEDEFHAAQTASLLDFRPLIPQPYPMTQEQSLYFNYILQTLFFHGNQTPKHLEYLAPGAFEALTSLVPSLNDPLKGGRVYLDDLRTRCLTPEMVHGLALACEQWPFRPEIVDLIGRDKKTEESLVEVMGDGFRGV